MWLIVLGLGTSLRISSSWAGSRVLALRGYHRLSCGRDLRKYSVAVTTEWLITRYSLRTSSKASWETVTFWVPLPLSASSPLCLEGFSSQLRSTLMACMECGFSSMVFGSVSSWMTYFLHITTSPSSPEITKMRFGSCCSKRHMPRYSGPTRLSNRDWQG